MIAHGLIKAVSALFDYVTREDPRYKDVWKWIAAQWALESAWGNSRLAKSFNNFGGMKYREEIATYVTNGPVDYKDWHGDIDKYCWLASPEDYPPLYFAFLDRERYNGKEKHLDHGADFMAFIVSRGYCTSMPGAETPEEVQSAYVQKLQDVMNGSHFKDLMAHMGEDANQIPEWLRL